MLKSKLFRFAALIFAVTLCFSQRVSACTGIALQAKDGSKIIARTMEWGGFVLGSHFVVVPRGHTRMAITPSGNDGMKLTAKYGYTGIAVLEHNFIAEAMNEKGLVVELFYFPGYGECQPYDPAYDNITITDAQILEWVVGSFATIGEMEKEINNIRMVTYGQGFESAHYRIADATGREVVVEYYDDKFHIFEDKIGVITNAPSFDWHMTNLNNYVNIFSGGIPERQVIPGVTIRSFGVGSASLGLPGDLTPPSRFVRAAFYIHTAPQQLTGDRTVLQCFQILNNFDIPIGTEFHNDEKVPDMLSGTQWTTASDTKGLKFYYRTEWNYTIRCVDLNQINFAKVRYQVHPLDKETHPIEQIRIH